MLILQGISYTHPDKQTLFENLNFAINHQEKVALVGNNGSGKSTLLRIIANELTPVSGQVFAKTDAYYVPQVFGQFNHLSVAGALNIETKLQALREILDGHVTQVNLDTLADDWALEERCNKALQDCQLPNYNLTRRMSSLSGGQKTKVFLAGILIHEPSLILLDEPSNHLDRAGREMLHQLIHSTTATVLMVSHDRELLNLADKVYELSAKGLKSYGGNYTDYAEQKKAEEEALLNKLHTAEKSLRKTKEKARESQERQNKLNARGKKKQLKAGVPKIAMNSLKGNAEKSTAKLNSKHTDKTDTATGNLSKLKSELPERNKMKFDFDDSGLHKGKTLFKAVGLNFKYDHDFLWKEKLNIQLMSGEMVALRGYNGSGKTTLIRIILGQLNAAAGKVHHAINKAIYIDQDYSLINNKLTIYQQAREFNINNLEEHDIKIRLDRFLFSRDTWDNLCSNLSGGERMRLMLCCLNIGNKAPDIIVLDEPTNNLDMANLQILTHAINDYQGTLLVVSHDEYFLRDIGIQREIELASARDIISC